MKRTALFGILLFISFYSLCAGQGNKVKPELDPGKLFDYQQITLDNGMKVITMEDFSCPIVEVQVWYGVGSKDEKPDRQGYAHIFEHMMFKGTDRVSEKDHFNLLRKVGGTCNAYTSFDQTVYYETLPADEIDLALWLEAERMSFLKIDQNAFDTERRVVEEELRMRENQPYGNVFKKMAAVIFADEPYRWTPIGKLADLRATSVSDLRQFWIDHYVPNNATLIIVGAIQHEKAQKLAKQYFGWIPAEPEPKKITFKEPQPTEPKKVVIDDENAPAGQVVLAWRTVSTGQRDETVLDLLSEILGSGHSSRLYRTLVADTQIAVDASTWTYNLQLEGIFVAEATLPPNSEDYDGAVKALTEQIRKIQAEGILDKELEKARNQLTKRLVTMNLSIESKARMLGAAAVSMGDISKVNTRIEEIHSVTKEDIQRAANQYVDMNRVFQFTIRQNTGMQNARKDDEEAAITAEPERQAPAPGRPGVKRPKNFPETAPLTKESEASFDLKYEQAKLSNGLQVLVIPNHEVPFVSVTLGLTNGAWTDTKPGTAAMTLSMLTRGTAKHNEAQLAEELEQYAISLGGSADIDTATVSMNCTTEQLDRGMGLLAEVVKEPAFPKEEFHKLLQQKITDLNIKEQDPRYLADKYLDKVLFGQHPYARTADGTVEDLKQLSIRDLREWWIRFGHPEKATLIFAGDITKQKAVELAKQYLGDWNIATPTPMMKLVAVPDPKPTTVYIVNRPGSAQAQIKVGQLGMTRRQQPDYFVSLLVSTYFGGSFYSRLSDNIRVKRGLSYDARGGYRAQNLAGTFAVSTFTKNETVAETINVIIDQVAELRTVEPTDSELNDTRSYFIGSFAGQRETPQDVARDLWLVESQGLGKNYFKKLFKGLDNATKQDCVELAEKTLDPDTLSIIIVGDAETLKEPLSNIAPVKVINPDSTEEK
ncbi:MAG: insulinase family protein [Phycisphaerae bacterium]|nr:insulinase family protein [Phycisphaerae bacterium]